MSLGILGVSSNIVSPKRTEHPNHWYTPTKTPDELRKEHVDKYMKQQEEKSKAKPIEERNLGDWFNVGMSYVKKFVESAEQTRKY